MRAKVVLAGGTGFLGRFLEKKFEQDGFEVVIIARSSGIGWNNFNAILNALNGAVAVINLAGKSVDCRYNESNRKEILESRVKTTSTLRRAIAACDQPPLLWLNASSATIYRDEKNRPNTEADGTNGEGFSVDVARQWEDELYSGILPKTRRCALRISIVLGKNGGVFPVYGKLVKSGLGGKQGNGKQMFSWIHIEDVYRAIRFIMENNTIHGPVNLASTHPVTNSELMNMLRKAFRIPFGLPSPKWLLEIGAVLIGTEPELILKSRWVIPDKLVKHGFEFQFPEIESAMKDLTTSQH